jgi:sugar phosphate isomerase/epimerase
MRLGISSYTYPWAVGITGCPPPRPLGPFDLVDRARALDVSVVQFGDNLPLDRLPAHELRSFAVYTLDQGITVELGIRGIAPDYVRRYLRLAEHLQASILRVVTDTADHQPGAEEIISAVRAILPDLASTGVFLAIENHDRFQARKLAGIVERLDSQNVGICLDTANSLGALEGPDVIARTLAPWTVNLHVKDIIVRRLDHGLGFIVEGCPAGQGQIDLPGLLALLRRHSRDPNVILEQWTPPGKTVSETIAREKAWAETGIGYLRTLVPTDAPNQERGDSHPASR